MKTLLLRFGLGGLLILAACGGQEIGTGGVSSSGAVGSSGSGGSAGASNDGGPQRPEAGTEACDDNAHCVLCSDDRWHCGPIVFDQCPAGAMPGEPCTPLSSNCYSCTSPPTGNTLTCVRNGSGDAGDVWTSDMTLLRCAL
jgi:hypothetical protein